MDGVAIIGNYLPGDLQLQFYPQNFSDIQYNVFVTLFKHDLTNLSTYSETYIRKWASKGYA